MCVVKVEDWHRQIAPIFMDPSIICQSPSLHFFPFPPPLLSSSRTHHFFLVAHPLGHFIIIVNLVSYGEIDTHTYTQSKNLAIDLDVYIRCERRAARHTSMTVIYFSWKKKNKIYFCGWYATKNCPGRCRNLGPFCREGKREREENNPEKSRGFRRKPISTQKNSGLFTPFLFKTNYGVLTLALSLSAFYSF